MFSHKLSKHEKAIFAILLFCASYILLILKRPFTVNELMDTNMNMNNKEFADYLNTTNNSTNMSIESVISRWNHLFKCFIIDTNPLTDCVTTMEEVKSLSINTYFKLNALEHNYSYHSMLSLRRQIMIISNIINNNSIVYHKLIQTFINMHNNHMNIRRNEKYVWFHMHVSKAAGRTISSTLKHTERLFSSRSRSRSEFEAKPQYAGYHGTSSNKPCREQYLYAKLPSHIAREDPMMTYSDDHLVIITNSGNNKTNDMNHAKPSLCRKFIYLLSFREPLERICSQMSQFNNQFAFGGKNFLRTSSSMSSIAKNENKKQKKYESKNLNVAKTVWGWWRNYCYTQGIMINGVEYRLILNGNDYMGLYKTLINSQTADGQQHIYSNQDVKQMTAETSTLSKYKLWQFDVPFCFRNKKGVHLFPIPDNVDSVPIQHLNESEFILVVSNSKSRSINVQWIRTKGTSNIYTSWLGYNDTAYLKNGISTIPNFIERNNINDQHFRNAVELILKIDYVLPFSTHSLNESADLNDNRDHKIWEVALNDMVDYYHEYYMDNNRKDSKYMNWRINNDFVYYYPFVSYEKKKIHWLSRGTAVGAPTKTSPKEICDSITNEERELLLRYNQFDLKLYQISKLIQRADTEFHEILENMHL